MFTNFIAVRVTCCVFFYSFSLLWLRYPFNHGITNFCVILSLSCFFKFTRHWNYFPLQVIVGQASVQRCNATVSFLSHEKPFYPPTVNDRGLHSHFLKVAGDMAGSENVEEMQLLMGSEDFAFFQEVIPGYFFFVGMKDEKDMKPASVHSPFFRINEDALPFGAALHASLATRFLLESNSEVPLLNQNLRDEL